MSKLREDEVVHHIDGDSYNNDPSNLQVMTREDHSRLHADKRHRNVCQVPECDQLCHGRGYCDNHYRQLLRGTLNKTPRICDIVGCMEKHLAKGMCSKHYHADRRKRKDR